MAPCDVEFVAFLAEIGPPWRGDNNGKQCVFAAEPMSPPGAAADRSALRYSRRMQYYSDASGTFDHCQASIVKNNTVITCVTFGLCLLVFLNSLRSFCLEMALNKSFLVCCSPPLRFLNGSECGAYGFPLGGHFSWLRSFSVLPVGIGHA